jgi:tRNA threonylcarbamoyl adenosine modification protein YeaZ
MNGLILETGTEKGIIVLSSNGKVTSFKIVKGGPSLATTLSYEVDLLLKEKPPLQFIAVGYGHGSYTGTRVGASLAKALAFGWNIPLIGFCTLESFVEEKACYPILLDARMGGFYYLEKSGQKSLKISFDEAENLLANVEQIGTPHPELIQKRHPNFRSKLIETDPNPHHLATLCHTLFLEGKIDPFAIIY